MPKMFKICMFHWAVPGEILYGMKIISYACSEPLVLNAGYAPTSLCKYIKTLIPHLSCSISSLGHLVWSLSVFFASTWDNFSVQPKQRIVYLRSPNLGKWKIITAIWSEFFGKHLQKFLDFVTKGKHISALV